MDSYLQSYAKIYDKFYQDKSYAQEAAFVNSCLQKFKDGPVRSLLELGCGTGSHALELEKYGYNILATDYSESMLLNARQKAANLSSKVCFEKQDMRSLDVPKEGFDSVISLFDAIGYVLTSNAVKQTLQGINRALRPAGLLMLEFWHGAAMVLNYESFRFRCLKTPQAALLRISETTLDYSQQIGNVNYTFHGLDNNGEYSVFKEKHANRYFFVQEMKEFLSTNGFKPLKFFSGFSECESITEDTWHIIALARKNK